MSEATEKVKVVLIDPIEKKISIQMMSSDGSSAGILKAMYELLDCRLVTTAGTVADCVIFADDEALYKVYKDKDGNVLDELPAFYCEEWYPGPIVGKSIIVGDSEGKTTSVTEAGLKELYKKNAANKLHWAYVDAGAEEFRILK